MAYPTWPNCFLPPITDSFSEGRVDTRSMDSNSIGGGDERQKTPRTMKKFSFTLWLSKPEKELLDDFYDCELQQVGKFYWPEISHSQESLRLVKFTNPPEAKAVPEKGGGWHVSVSIVDA